MKTADIRQKFLTFFQERDHTVVESAPLVPHNDPTLLFTNAGMVPFKDVFLGKDKRSYTRATSAQKCVRAGGKHNDLENVGFTARHHTFFEMLGNFSFGDYFKKEAIAYAWEFSTQVLKLPLDRLYVTVYEKDDEAAKIWQEQEGVPADRIYRFGDKDNFWSMGDTGPCGPCSELFYDRGEAYGCGNKDCTVGCECDRYMEYWNLVFMQYDRDSEGTLHPLPKPSVDTGSGLERLASILQDVATNYDTDAFRDIIQATAQLLGKRYAPDQDDATSYRVVADHARAATFLIGDGVIPANEGRGYVLRRIIRRAIRHGRELGFREPFLHDVCGFVIDQMVEAYPALEEQREFIRKCVQAEEEQFLKTLDKGLDLLHAETKGLKKGDRLPGDIAFKLYDTFGFPLDLTRVICAEAGLGIDEAGFEKSMDEQKQRSRASWQGSGETAQEAGYYAIAEQLAAAGKSQTFVGYDTLTADASECLAIVSQDGAKVAAVFDNIPFYGESGGQVGDKGEIAGPGFKARVLDTQKPLPDLIVTHLEVTTGELKVGGSYATSVARDNRQLIARNHTATHLLHWALRDVLGKHVKQAGSLVNADLLRFDFTHFQGVTDEELQTIEDRVNEKIWAAEPVTKQEMGKDEAVAAGAIAFFGEKYGDKVRVVSVGADSVELCGGTHVSSAAEINVFKIASEGGIAAGVRRIIAYTSKGAYRYLGERERESRLVRDRLKAASTDEVRTRIDKLFATEKDLRKQIEKMQGQNLGATISALVSDAKSIKETPVIISLCDPDPQGVKVLRDMAERIRQKAPGAVAVLGMNSEASGKAFLLATAGKEAPKALNANKIIQSLAPMIEGRGGGKPDLAQAGGTKADGLPAALKQAESLITELLS